jgi:hypothetical protein
MLRWHPQSKGIFERGNGKDSEFESQTGWAHYARPEQDQETEHAEITDLLNSELDSEDRSFRAKEVAEWLQSASDTTITLYWLRTRPRK